MTSTALLERALGASGHEPAIITDDGCHRGDRLAAMINDLPFDAEAGSGSVALCLADPLKLAVALLGLDGIAERILLLSPALRADDRAALVAGFAPTLLLTDTDLPAPGCRVVRWQADAASQGFRRAKPGRDTLWTLATSGTTATPKLVEHRLASLVRRTKPPREGAALRWGQLYDPYRFAGVQVFLQGLLGGDALLLPPPTAPLDEKLAFFARHGCTALSGTPTLWRKIVMSADVGLPLRQVTLGGEIADDAILARLARQYPAARICHVYASTEAGAGFSVVDGRAGFPAAYLDQPPAGVEIRIRDDELQIRNPFVGGAYLGDTARFADDEGFVRTGDIVRRVGDRVEFRGRGSGVINVGGNKLHPEEVERVLLAHASVSQAHVYGRPSPITGQIVAAEIVARRETADLPALVTNLRQACRNALPAWQVPVAIKVVEDLPLGASGKLGRARA